MKAFYLILIAGLLTVVTACTTVHNLGNGRYAVPRTAEVRSPFGTNAGFVKLENCQGTVPPGKVETVYSDCDTIIDWRETQSQGQGGQIVGGALTGLGFGLGNAFGPSNGASASQSQSVIVPATKSHH